MHGWEPVAIIGTLIPIFGMAVGLGIALFAINRSYKRRELEHHERMLAIQKGVLIPPTPESTKPKTNYPFAWPFAMMGFGIALIFIYIFTGHGYQDQEALGFGLVILFVGLGLFVSRFVGVRKEQQKEEEFYYDEHLSADPTPSPFSQPASQTSGTENKTEEQKGTP